MLPNLRPGRRLSVPAPPGVHSRPPIPGQSRIRFPRPICRHRFPATRSFSGDPDLAQQPRLFPVPTLAAPDHPAGTPGSSPHPPPQDLRTGTGATPLGESTGGATAGATGALCVGAAASKSASGRETSRIKSAFREVFGEGAFGKHSNDLSKGEGAGFCW